MLNYEVKLTDQTKSLLSRGRERLADEGQFVTILTQRVGKTMNIAAGETTKAMLSGGVLKRRTGTLARSVVGGVRRDGDAILATIGIYKGPARVYGPVQELGTKGKNPKSPFPTIKPKKRNGYLAVPTDDGGALTPAGVPRYPGARQFPERLVFIRGRTVARVGSRELTAGAALYRASDINKVTAARFAGDRAFYRARFSIRPVYLLLRKVDIAPKGFLRSGMERAVKRLDADIAGAMEKLLGV